MNGASMSTVPATPKTSNQASVANWLVKHFGAVKAPFQADSNPYEARILKDFKVNDAGRAKLLEHLRAHPEWVESKGLYFACNGVTLHMAPRSGKPWREYFSFSCPKRAKPRTIPYYD